MGSVRSKPALSEAKGALKGLPRALRALGRGLGEDASPEGPSRPLGCTETRDYSF